MAEPPENTVRTGAAALLGAVALTLAVAALTAPRASAGVPCAAVIFSVDARLGPADGHAIVLDAVREIEALTQMPFVERGDATLTIAWVEPPKRWDALTVGRGAGDWVIDAEPYGLRSGRVELRAGASLPSHQWRDILLHELGHVMGLGHSPEGGDVMSPNTTPMPRLWGELDREQLAERGRRAGCVARPNV
jgi:hypothetical protein